MERKNLAARAAHWSAAHRKTAIFGWLGFVVVARVHRQRRRPEPDPRRRPVLRRGRPRRADALRVGPAAQRRARAHPERDPDGRGPGVRPAIRRARRRAVEDRGRRRTSSSPLRRTAPVSEDGHSALVDFEITGRRPRGRRTASTRRRTRSTRSPPITPSLNVEQFGTVSTNKELRRSSSPTSARPSCCRCRSRC